jgi:hypothetical protein
MTVLNPTTFTITDATAKADGVTAITVHVGTTTGGPYPTAFPITSGELSAGMASGNFTGTLASIGDSLGAGTYFAVATATNPTGVSGNSPEVTFQVLALPQAPTVFSVA